MNATAESTDEKSSQVGASVLITITTPEAATPICRLAGSEDVIAEITVRQLIERVISPNSLFSVGVPLSQLETESPAAMAIGEMLSADCCEVFAGDNGQEDRELIPLNQPAHSLAREQVGEAGHRFLNISLIVQSRPDTGAAAGDERRQVPVPDSVETETELPALGMGDDAPDSQPEQPGEAPNSKFVTIVAEAPTQEAATNGGERKEYIRKSDWLRAQFRPEVDVLDFSGLFVGNLGFGIREEKGRRNVVLADPSRTTEVLLRANGYRRSGEHAKALICYQELVDMDPANADFRYLLGQTLVELGQADDAIEVFVRAKELGHEGAEKQLEQLKRDGHGQRSPLGFLRFWK